MNQRTIIFKNRIEEVERIAAFVEGVSEELDLQPAVVGSLQLAIEEAVVNVINYAYPDRTECDSSLMAKWDDTSLTFILSDSGVPFDPTRAADPDLSLGLEERPIGGLGIFLIKKIMNEVSYEYINSCNVLTMIKNL
ncbi:MAG: ATP-binding protein [Bacteroidales bacterium]|nr:ATP-binding protein [Bacteroidales bacterium]